VSGQKRGAQRIDVRAVGLDDQQLFGIFVNVSFPAENRCDARDDVDARGQSQFDQFPCERSRVEIGADGGQNDDGIHAGIVALESRAVFRRILLFLVIAILLIAGYEWVTFPDVSALATTPPSTTAFMEQRKAELRAAGKSDAIEYRWVAYDRISPYLRRGVLVAEDDAFYAHDGVDVKALEEAIRKDWARKQATHGGSTITQQLAKNLYLSPSRNPLRKLKEYFIARSLESHLTKKRILELYLNVVEMGERVYGAEAAAHSYFHISAASLSPSQAALLAGCLPNPRIMNPGAPNKRLRWRQRMVLSRMRRWGYLFEREVLTEKKAPAAATPVQTETTATVDTALQQTPPADTATPEPTATTTAPAPPTETQPEPPAETTTTSGSAPPSTTSK
jgi:monofunctional biosynthetic peptidoglycan transglycosylase